MKSILNVVMPLVSVVLWVWIITRHQKITKRAIAELQATKELNGQLIAVLNAMRTALNENTDVVQKVIDEIYGAQQKPLLSVAVEDDDDEDDDDENNSAW